MRRSAYEDGQPRSRTRVQKAKQELVCPVCIETFKEPRTLTCQHTFCTSCLQQLADTSRNSTSEKVADEEITISCPECRANVIVPKSGVRGLPKNFKLESLADILNVEKHEKLTCGSVCEQPHNYCPIHTKKVTEYFCTSCGTPACGDCLLEQHLNHKGVKRVTEVLEQCALALRELIPDANDALKRGAVSLKAVQKHSKCLVQQGTEVTQDIEAYFNKIRDLLMKRELELKQEVTDEVERGCKQIESNALALKHSMEEIKKTTQNIEQVTESKSLELPLKQKQLKSDFELNQKQLNRFCETTSELQRLSIKCVPLENTRLEVLCQTLGARAPIPLPRKSKVHVYDRTPIVERVEEASCEDYAESGTLLSDPNKNRSYVDQHYDTCARPGVNLSPDGKCLEEAQVKQEGSDAPLLPPPAPMRNESFNYKPVVIQPHLIWGSQHISNTFFQFALGSVYPRGVCCGVSDTLVVTDIQNHCIRILAPTGKCLNVIGKEGTGDEEFGEPTAVTTDLDGNLLVCNLFPAKLQKFSPEGKFITKLTRMFHSNPLGEPWGVAVNHEGKIFVSDWDRSCIHTYNDKGRYVGNFGSTGNDTHLKYPAGIAIDKRGRIIVADRGNHVVCVYSPDGNLLSRFGKMGRAPGELYFPFGVAVNKDSSNIFISESGNHRISVFDAQGKFLRCFGNKGSAPGNFHLPRHICIDREERLIVSDEQNQRIQIFTSY